MAIASGIPYSVWAEEDERIIWTAFKIYEEQEKDQRKQNPRMKGGDYPVMSG